MSRGLDDRSPRAQAAPQRLDRRKAGSLLEGIGNLRLRHPRSVGMSRESAYQLCNRPSAAAFRRGWDDALDCSLRLLEDEMWSRAIKGVPRPVFYQG